MEKFKAPPWCHIKNSSVKDAILGAAEIVGAKVYQSVSFIFSIEDFERLQKYLKKRGKDPVNEAIMKLVEEEENGQ
jgi:hypothetical protein